MKNFYRIFLFFTTWLIPFTSYAEETIHHEMKILLKPKTSYIEVEDTITIPEKIFKESAGNLFVSLNGNLHLLSATNNVEFIPIPVKDDSDHHTSDPMVYKISIPSGIHSFTLKYQGKIYQPLAKIEEEYSRSFNVTSGLISSEGFFLSEASRWYPNFNDYFLTFKLDVKLPKGWDVISQGSRKIKMSGAKFEHIQWNSTEPQDEIYLIGGEYIEYKQLSDYTQAMVLLRAPDKPLADKYLKTTIQYIKMYSKLIGPYPYKKFALVENFWETGYGMPSFTLLGPKVIRFPFILHTSYPHEILHNWWGNSVFVDYQTGNWCEGLTSYLADHLIKEQHGKGAEYRRTALQKYTDYVKLNKDFPLTEFRSRHSSITQAVGYDKTLMFFHMLRNKLGDDVFRQGLQKFYENYKFRYAKFEDWEKVFSEVSGKDLKTDFKQWITRTGAPKLQVEKVATKKENDKHILTGLLKQTQEGPGYKLEIPIAVYLDGLKEPYRTTLFMRDKQLKISLNLPTAPLRLDIDPDFDVFRRLNRKEIPPALTQVFGAEKVLIILPTKASEELKQMYLELAESWKNSRLGTIDIKYDNQLKVLPTNRSVWIWGWENLFRQEIATIIKDYGVSIHNNEIDINNHKINRKNHSVVFTLRNPTNESYSIAWMATDNINAISGLGRKLPHYRKYSYLIFEGQEPSIVLKEQWPTINSPMSILIRQKDGSLPQNIKSEPVSRTALADLPLN
jgi:hypothetical protein